MQNNISQQILRKQQAKKAAKYAVILILAIAFILGAFLSLNKTINGSENSVANAAGSTAKADYTIPSNKVEATVTSIGNNKYTFPVSNLMQAEIIVFGGEFVTHCGYNDVSLMYTDGLDEGYDYPATISNGVATVTISDYSATKYGIYTDKPRVSLPETPTAPEGQHFVGWYYDAALTNPYKDGDVLYEETSLYAKFSVDTCVITYNLNGFVYSTSEVNYGEAASNVSPTGVTVGKRFSGWYTDAAMTQKYDFKTSSVKSNITLYGSISTITFEVTFYVDGELYATLVVPYGCTLVEYAASSAEGAATAAEIIEVYNLSPEASEVITDDIVVTATMKDSLLKWNNFGVWLGANWPWIVAVVGVVIVIITGSVILAKKRR